MLEKSETFSISGCVQRADGGEITQAEVEAFMDSFFELLEAQGLGFGGGYGLDLPTVEESCERELVETALQLHNLAWMLENELSQEVRWKPDAEALIQKMGLVWQEGRLCRASR